MKIIQQTNMTRRQSMGYVLQAASGEVLVIDSGHIGNDCELERLITSVGGHVDLWLITHPHIDHYAALIELFVGNTKVTFDKIGSTFLSDEWARSLKSASETRELLYWNSYLPNFGEKLFEIKAGQSFDVGSMHVEILTAANPELTFNPLNNQSCAIRVTEGDFKMLFLGDMGVEAGRKLLASGHDLRADGVQMAHHGQEGVEEEVYRAIAPTYAFWPTPIWLWVNSHSRLVIPDSANFQTPETIEWMRRLKTVNVVSFTHSTLFDTETREISAY